jgi:hypothetical protein
MHNKILDKQKLEICCLIRHKFIKNIKVTILQSKRTTWPSKRPLRLARKWILPSHWFRSTLPSTTSRRSRKILTSVTNFLRKEVIGNVKTNSKYMRESTNLLSETLRKLADFSLMSCQLSMHPKSWTIKLWSLMLFSQGSSAWTGKPSRRKYYNRVRSSWF